MPGYKLFKGAGQPIGVTTTIASDNGMNQAHVNYPANNHQEPIERDIMNFVFTVGPDHRRSKKGICVSLSYEYSLFVSL